MIPACNSPYIKISTLTYKYPSLVVQVILVYDLLGNEFDCYPVIFGPIHWIIQVEVLEIYYKVFSVWGVEYDVPMDFGCG